MADLTFTTIEEEARAALKISRDEYAICNYVQTWSAHPKNRRPGFCDRTKGQMASFIGISPRGIMKMLDKMERVELIERFSETLFVHRITQTWFDVVTLAKRNRKGEQSSSLETDQKENKVPLKGEQSSSLGGNKVLPHKEYSKKGKDKQQQKEIEAADFLIKTTTEFPNVTIAELQTVEAKKEKTPQVAPTPKKEKEILPDQKRPDEMRRYDAFDIEQAADEMISDYRCFEKYATDSGKGADATLVIFADTVRAFVKDQLATVNTYPNRTEFRKHFFNFVRRKSEIARNNNTTKPGTQAQQPGQTKNKAILNHWGKDPTVYNEKQKF